MIGQEKKPSERIGIDRRGYSRRGEACPYPREKSRTRVGRKSIERMAGTGTGSLWLRADGGLLRNGNGEGEKRRALFRRRQRRAWREKRNAGEALPQTIALW